MNRELLNTIVRELPAKFDEIFEQSNAQEGVDRGDCVTYSMVLGEVLAEFGIKAIAWPVYIVTTNEVGRDFLKGKITARQAAAQNGKFQIWGDIAEGQPYQHAVCYIPEWAVVVDLSMAQRKSRLVPCHPYWFVWGEQPPSWMHSFRFETYALTCDGYWAYPDRVLRLKAAAREVIKRALEALKEE